MSGLWSSTNLSGPGTRNTAGMVESSGGYGGRDEKAARKRAEEAERKFRESKGYAPKGLLARLRLLIKK